MHSTPFATTGFALVPDVLSVAQCAALADRAASVPAGAAGSRCLLAEPWCAALVPQLRAHPALSPLLLASPVAVQCTWFEKSAAVNWLVPVHQDLSIPVAARVDHPELRGWSVKEGTLFVQPPPSLLERMVAVRVHLDDCMLDDGPLRVVPGSHRHGVVAPAAAAEARAHEVPCVARRGTVLAMRPLLLHSSPKSRGDGRRRVLHFLFGPHEPPCGLSWRNPV